MRREANDGDGDDSRWNDGDFGPVNVRRAVVTMAAMQKVADIEEEEDEEEYIYRE